MFAILSDIHSNLEALTVVLADIQKRGIKTIYCLGDVIGYGPNPKECLDLIIDKAKWCVPFPSSEVSKGARRGGGEEEKRHSDRRWSFLGNLPMRQSLQTPVPSRENKTGEKNTAIMDFVHASPRRPVNEYIFPDDVYTNPAKVRLLFERIKHICFVGHTHMPGVFLDEPDFYLPDELGNVYPIIDDEKAIINIGSVGQPRDRDNRASYVYVNENQVHFVRLEYDFETTAKKIMAIEQLDNFHAERLRDGR